MADTSIDINVYIFHCDELGQRLTEALELAVLRGVRVRLLVDGVGADLELPIMLSRFLALGGMLKIYHPLPWNFSHWPYATVQVKGLNKFAILGNLINRRNHQKSILIDRSHAWLGSYNFSAFHLPGKVHQGDWLDVGIKIKPVQSDALADAFDVVWHQRRIRLMGKTPRYFSDPFRFNFSRKLRKKQRRFLLHKIAQAGQRIWIMNAYFVPDRHIVEALSTAAQRGVQVRLLLPQKSDIFFIPWASATYYARLHQAGVQLYEYTAGILHAKTIIMDAWGSVGSSNINARSLKHDLECDYNLQEKQSFDELESLFDKTFRGAQLLDNRAIIIKKRWHRWLGTLLVALFGYWV